MEYDHQIIDQKELTPFLVKKQTLKTSFLLLWTKPLKPQEMTWGLRMLYYLQLINGETQIKVPMTPIHNEIETFFHHRSSSPVRINSFLYLEEIAGTLLLCKVTGSEVYRCCCWWMLQQCGSLQLDIASAIFHIVQCGQCVSLPLDIVSTSVAFCKPENKLFWTPYG